MEPARVLSFFIPGVPRPKERARVVERGGKMRGVTPKRTRDYEALVALYARQAVAKAPDWPKDAIIGCSIVLGSAGARVTLMVLEGRKRRMRGDVENYSKSISDAMNKIAYNDDRQIVCLTVQEEP